MEAGQNGSHLHLCWSGSPHLGLVNYPPLTQRKPEFNLGLGWVNMNLELNRGFEVGVFSLIEHEILKFESSNYPEMLKPGVGISNVLVE